MYGGHPTPPPKNGVDLISSFQKNGFSGQTEGRTPA